MNESLRDEKKNFTLIESGDALARLTGELEGSPRVALDIEANGLHRYFEKVCLLQICFSGKAYVIDPLTGISLEGFLSVLAGKELIIHAADYDLRMLKKSYGFKPLTPVFDTLLAAQVLGYEKIGLAALVERFFNVVLPKSGQKSDWSRRPLPHHLLQYAADDVRYLEAMADRLKQDLKLAGRLEWHRECCERVVRTAAQPDKNEAKEDVWRIKGSSRLPLEVQVYVRELWKWRDDEARRRDRPPFMILQNEQLLELAQWAVKNPGKPLFDGPAFLARRQGEERMRLEEAVKTAASLPRSEWPKLEERKKPFWQGDRNANPKTEQLMAVCKALAEELKIESGFLAPRAAMTAAAMHQPTSVESLMEVSGLMQWQSELLMPRIKEVLEAKS